MESDDEGNRGRTRRKSSFSERVGNSMNQIKKTVRSSSREAYQSFQRMRSRSGSRDRLMAAGNHSLSPPPKRSNSAPPVVNPLLTQVPLRPGLGETKNVPYQESVSPVLNQDSDDGAGGKAEAFKHLKAELHSRTSLKSEKALNYYGGKPPELVHLGPGYSRLVESPRRKTTLTGEPIPISSEIRRTPAAPSPSDKIKFRSRYHLPTQVKASKKAEESRIHLPMNFDHKNEQHRNLRRSMFLAENRYSLEMHLDEMSSEQRSVFLEGLNPL